jgi:hypothetical protein
MESGILRFVVSSASITEYLILEAYIDDKYVADVFNENGVWQVDFMPNNTQWSLSWEIFTKIHQHFANFVEEMKTYPINLPAE